jgi:hypothetical protein
VRAFHSHEPRRPLREIAKHTRADSGADCGAERTGFQAGGNLHARAEHVGRDLREERAPRHAARDPQRAELGPRRREHLFEVRAQTAGDPLQRRAREVTALARRTAQREVRKRQAGDGQPQLARIHDARAHAREDPGGAQRRLRGLRKDVGDRVRLVRKEQTREPGERAARRTGIALQHPALRHDVVSRPEAAVRVDARRIEHDLDGCRGSRDGREGTGLHGTRTEESALGVAATDRDGNSRAQSERLGGRLPERAEPRTGCADLGKPCARNLEAVRDVLRPARRRQLEEQRLAGLRRIGRDLATEPERDPVTRGQRVRGALAQLGAFRPEPAQSRGHHDGRGPVSGAFVQELAAFRRELDRLPHRAAVRIGQRDERPSLAIEHHQAEAHARGGDSGDLLGAGVRARERLARRVAEESPEDVQIEVARNTRHTGEGGERREARRGEDCAAFDLDEQAADAAAAEVQPHQEASTQGRSILTPRHSAGPKGVQSPGGGQETPCGKFDSTTSRRCARRSATISGPGVRSSR